MDPPLPDWLAEYQQRRAQECQTAQAEITGLLDQLTELGVASVYLEYDGCGDDGCIQDVKALAAQGQELPLPEDLHDELVSNAEILLPAGWENNEGAFGTLVLDVAQRKLTRQHNWRIEASEYEEEVWTL